MLARSQEGQRPLRLLYWGETRWNSKVDAMGRVFLLHAAVNFVLSNCPEKTQHRLLEEEIASMAKSLPFLKIFADATVRIQKVDTRLSDIHGILENVQSRLAEFSLDPVYHEAVACARASIARRQQAGFLLSDAAAAGAQLDSKKRNKNNHPSTFVEAEEFEVEFGAGFFIYFVATLILPTIANRSCGHAICGHLCCAVIFQLHSGRKQTFPNENDT